MCFVVCYVLLVVLGLLCVGWCFMFVVLRVRVLLYVFRCCRCLLFVVE